MQTEGKNSGGLGTRLQILCIPAQLVAQAHSLLILKMNGVFNGNQCPNIANFAKAVPYIGTKSNYCQKWQIFKSTVNY